MMSEAQALATFTVMLALPESESKATTSPATGKLAPEAAPDVAAQFVVLFQLPVPPATRKRLATTSPCDNPIP